MIIGLGRSGHSVARLLKKNGVQVVATDKAPRKKISENILDWFDENKVEIHSGDLTGELLQGINLVVPSPGVPLDQSFFDTVRSRKIEIVGELALAGAMYKKPIIAVTGTNGKSTVTELIGEMLISSGYTPFVGGNLGIPLAEHLLGEENTDVAVLEVSSFQLDTAPYFRPDIAVLLNISPDHLDRYKTYEGYVASKISIFKDQEGSDYGVINSDDPESSRYISQRSFRSRKTYFGKHCPPGHPSASIAGSEVIFSSGNDSAFEHFDLSGGVLESEPNCYNAAAAIIAAKIFGCSQKGIEQALHTFEPLGHRMSLVGEVSGIKYYDDSKATNIGAVSAALRGFASPVVLIAGGRDKGGDYRLMLDQVSEKVKAMIVIGEAQEKMMNVFAEVTDVIVAKSMEAAVVQASKLADSGDSVLLSPACASFDMFDSYSHRGEVFRNAVEAIMREMEV